MGEYERKLSMSDVERLCSVSRRTVYRWMEGVPYGVVLRRLDGLDAPYFASEELRRFLREKEHVKRRHEREQRQGRRPSAARRVREARARAAQMGCRA